MKEFLSDKGIEFTSRDIQQDPTAVEDLQKVSGGVTSVPVIVVGDEVIVGFDRTKLQKALGIS